MVKIEVKVNFCNFSKFDKRVFYFLKKNYPLDLAETKNIAYLGMISSAKKNFRAAGPPEVCKTAPLHNFLKHTEPTLILKNLHKCLIFNFFRSRAQSVVFSDTWTVYTEERGHIHPEDGLPDGSRKRLNKEGFYIYESLCIIAFY